MEIALKAGYSYEGGLSAIRKMIGLGLDYSSFEGLSRDHPSWYDRIAQLDRNQAKLWRSLSAFQNGTYFLIVQNYPLAERSFRRVHQRFPEFRRGMGQSGVCTPDGIYGLIGRACFTAF